MAAIFIDTSSLARRYLPTEPGAREMRRLCRRTSGHVLATSRIASVEMASALNRRFRQGMLTGRQRDQLWRLFRKHRRSQYHSVAADDEILEIAERLLSSYQLRSLDAIQLASALKLARVVTQLGSEFRFCTADRRQADAARDEGLTVEFIS